MLGGFGVFVLLDFGVYRNRLVGGFTCRLCELI